MKPTVETYTAVLPWYECADFQRVWELAHDRAAGQPPWLASLPLAGVRGIIALKPTALVTSAGLEGMGSREGLTISDAPLRAGTQVLGNFLKSKSPSEVAEKIFRAMRLTFRFAGSMLISSRLLGRPLLFSRFGATLINSPLSKSF